MGTSKGWGEKYTSKGLRKRKTFLPLSAAEQEEKRKAAAKRKKLSRERRRDELREITRTQSASCADIEWIKRFVVEVPERPGCWIWKGPWRVSHSKSKPVVKRGEYGSMNADRAVWHALQRPGLIKRNYLCTTCGHPDCVSPEHLYVTNQTLERARKNLRGPSE